MSLVAAIIGTMVGNAGYQDPGGVNLTGNPNLSAGVVRRDYNQGYFADDTTWFNLYSPSATTHPTNIDIGQELNESGQDLYSIQWTGYFSPLSTTIYRFRTYSDDASYFWIGSNAVTSYSTANCNVDNGGLHGSNYVNGTPVSLTSGLYYPIRAQYGENTGGAEMKVEFTTDDGNTWTVINNMVYDNTTADGFVT